MANLVTKDGIYVVRFRFQGKEFKRSLKTRSRRNADGAKTLVEATIHRLLTGQLFVPAGVDPADFIVSGGTLQPRAPVMPPPIFPTTREVIEQYLDAMCIVNSPNYHSSQTTHLSHLKKFLGEKADAPCSQVTQQVLESYLQGRLKIRDPETVARERVTLLQLYNSTVRVIGVD